MYNQTMEDSSYNINADIVRILAGFGVVFIHVSDPFLTYPPYLTLRGTFFEILFFINTFFKVSVPLFIMLSGYFLLRPSKNFNAKNFYQRRLARIGIPLFVWLTVFFICKAYLDNPVSFSVIIKRIVNVDVEHLYFLFVIAGLYYVTPLFMAFINTASKTGHQILTASSIVFTILITDINYLFPEIKINFLGNVLTVFIPFIMYYLLGFYIRHYKVRFSWPFAAGLTIVAVTGISWFLSNGEFFSYVRNSGGIVVLFMVTALFIVIMQNSLIDKLKSIAPAKKVITTLASSIFGIYLVHMLIINIMDVNKFWFPSEIPNPIWLYVLSKSVFVFAICFVITVIVKKIPYVRLIFG
jgi:surface polysaccharide O-acyltransferase-like enzyme